MTDHKELSYLRKRMLQERELASCAACAKARAAHGELVTRYEARLTMGHLHQANAERRPDTVPMHTQSA